MKPLLGGCAQTEDQDSVAAPESRIISSATLPLSASSQTLVDCRRLDSAGLSFGYPGGASGRAFRRHHAGARRQRSARAHPPRTTVKPAAIRPHYNCKSAPPRPQSRTAPKALPAAWNGPPILAELANAEGRGLPPYVVDYPGSRYAQAMTALVSQFDSPDPVLLWWPSPRRKMAKAKAPWRCRLPAPPPTWAESRAYRLRSRPASDQDHGGAGQGRTL